MPETLFDELKRYVGFAAADEAALRALHPIVTPRFTEIAHFFYQRILEHDQARKALQGGESQVGRLKVTLVQWMDKLFSGPWDEGYYEMRARIGRVHVRIALPQHYMFGAMNIVRQQLQAVVDDAYITAPDKLSTARAALGKILDLELAIMLHTYREDLLTAGAKTERLATFGQLVGSIGHELRNPLGVMETSLYILRSRVAADERAMKHVERIGQQLGIANSIISDLLDMIRDRPIKPERLSVQRVVDAAIAQVRHADGVRIEVAGVDALPEVEGDASALRQVFVNLLDNGVHACGEGGTVRVEGALEDGRIAVAVQDSGPGVDEATQRRLFEPLITTKQKGIGLGLALVKRFVERQHGTVAYEPRGPGARFVVRLPLLAG